MIRSIIGAGVVALLLAGPAAAQQAASAGCSVQGHGFECQASFNFVPNAGRDTGLAYRLRATLPARNPQAQIEVLASVGPCGDPSSMVPVLRRTTSPGTNLDLGVLGWTTGPAPGQRCVVVTSRRCLVGANNQPAACGAVLDITGARIVIEIL